MNEWLKLMLEEIRRKQRERAEAQQERQRRASGERADGGPAQPPAGPPEGR